MLMIYFNSSKNISELIFTHLKLSDINILIFQLKVQILKLLSVESVRPLPRDKLHPRPFYLLLHFSIRNTGDSPTTLLTYLHPSISPFCIPLFFPYICVVSWFNLFPLWFSPSPLFYSENDKHATSESEWRGHINQLCCTKVSSVHVRDATI